VVTREIRDAIASGATGGHIAELAGRSGHTTLAQDGWNKAAAGITTVEEVIRVTQSDV